MAATLFNYTNTDGNSENVLYLPPSNFINFELDLPSNFSVIEIGVNMSCSNGTTGNVTGITNSNPIELQVNGNLRNLAMFGLKSSNTEFPGENGCRFCGIVNSNRTVWESSNNGYSGLNTGGSDPTKYVGFNSSSSSSTRVPTSTSIVEFDGTGTPVQWADDLALFQIGGLNQNQGSVFRSIRFIKTDSLVTTATFNRQDTASVRITDIVDFLGINSIHKRQLDVGGFPNIEQEFSIDDLESFSNFFMYLPSYSSTVGWRIHTMIINIF